MNKTLKHILFLSTILFLSGCYKPWPWDNTVIIHCPYPDTIRVIYKTHPEEKADITEITQYVSGKKTEVGGKCIQGPGVPIEDAEVNTLRVKRMNDGDHPYYVSTWEYVYINDQYRTIDWIIEHEQTDEFPYSFAEVMEQIAIQQPGSPT